jgi:hypothetical protein
MICKLPKSEAWKQSDPDRMGLLLHSRYSCRDSLLESIVAELPHLSKLEPIGQEALWPSEPHHSPDKAMPSYYTKNEGFASGISKWWCLCRLSPRGEYL